MGPEAKRAAALGASVGLGFALIAWAVDITFRQLGFDLDGLIESHTTNGVIWLADLSPFALGLLGALAGRAGDVANATRHALEQLELQARDLRRYKEAMEALTEGILLEQEGTVVEANATAGRILGLAPEALKDQPIERFLPQIHEPNAGVQVVRATAYGELVGMAWRHDGSDAQDRTIKLEVVSIMLPEQERVLHLLRDVTEEQLTAARKRRVHQTLVDERDRAEAKDSSKQRFLAGLAHELRTPLASMRGYLELLEEEAAEQAPEAFRDLGRVRIATDQVLEVVERIHDQANLDAGKLSLYLVPVDVEELIHEVINTLRPLVPVDVGLSAKIRAPLEAARADRRRLRQVLLTLVSNAAQSTTRGSITVEALSDEGKTPPIQIVVRDTGVGIPKGELKSIFSPFSGQTEGPGLSVAVSHELTKLMNGELSVASTQGKGTAFTIRLPAAVDDVKIERLVRTRTRVGRGRVLLIADDPRVRGRVESSLGARGIHVVTVDSVVAATDAAEALMPSAVVVDLGLSHSDPWSEMVQLAGLAPLSQAPVLGITIDGAKAALLATRGIMPSPPNRKRLHERASSVGHPNAPAVVFGAAQGVVEPLRDLGWQVIEASDADAAAASLERAGLLIVDLLGDEAAGLGFAMGRVDTLPVLGLLPTAITEVDDAAARAVLEWQVRTHGQPVHEVLDELIRRLGPETAV